MTASQSTNPDDTKPKIDLNLPQVAAAALAAVTAAVLGSGLGAAGTLIGAALASVITTVATALYRASLEHSRERVRSLVRRTRPGPVSLEEARTERFHPVAANAPPGNEWCTGSTDGESRPWDRSRLFATLRWGVVVVGSVGAFMLAMMVITGFEWASGETIGGNGEGTTIERVVSAPPSPQHRTGRPAPPSSSTSPSEAPTETTETTETPETTESTETTATPEPSSTLTATTTPGSDTGAEQNPSTTSAAPTPTEVTRTPQPVPTELPEPGADRRTP